MPRTKKLIFSEDLSESEYLKEINGELYTTDHFLISLKNRFKSISDYSDWIKTSKSKRTLSELWDENSFDLDIIKELDEKYKEMPSYLWNFKELFKESGEYDNWNESICTIRTIYNLFSITFKRADELIMITSEKKVVQSSRFTIEVTVPDKLIFKSLCYESKEIKQTLTHSPSHYNLKNLQKADGTSIMDFWGIIEKDLDLVIRYKEDDREPDFKRLILGKKESSNGDVCWRIKSHIEDIILGEYLIEMITYRYYYGRNK